jgi:hypothetical protein
MSTDDIKAIDELRAMARVYELHGFADKAQQLLKLAEAMEERVRRSAERTQIISMNQFRAEHPAREDDDSNEQAN